MIATLSIVALLLALLTLPGFSHDHVSVVSPWVVLCLLFAAVLVIGAPLGIMRRSQPAYAGLWVSVGAYVALLVVEPFILRHPLAAGSTPWLVILSVVAFSCVAVAEDRPVHAVIICVGLDAALSVVYAGRIAASHSVVNTVGLGLLALGLIAGVKKLRVRADHADAAEHVAQLLFENQHRQTALEKERVHTDALLHDSVLATLLAAAGGEAPERATAMARSALEIISEAEDHPVMKPATVRFGDALTLMAEEFEVLKADAHVDLAAGHDIDLPPDTADALIAAALQALKNSVKHAGAGTHRSAVASCLPDGGVRIVVADDGKGFDASSIAQERLGVRVSILESVRHAGGFAEIQSFPGRGTTVILQWQPHGHGQPLDREPHPLRIKLIPERQLFRILAAIIIMAILTAISETVVFDRAIGPLLAAVIGLLILPQLTRGARTGMMSRRTAWSIAGGGILLCCTATIGLDPNKVDSVSIYWYTCGILAAAVMVWMAGHRAPPIAVVAFQLAQITLWAGPSGAIRLGLTGEIVLVIAGLMLHRAIRRISAAADISTSNQRQLAMQKTEIDAFHLERQQRLQHARTSAAPLLQRIIDTGRDLTDASRAECRVLEQALRDEIRGRSLLNTAMRAVVSAHRHRGAYVQVLDDGGLDGIPPDTLNALLDDAARQLTPLQSARIVIRAGQPDSDTAITIVASSPDETAAALGLDTDDEVDLWVTIPRPISLTVAA